MIDAPVQYVLTVWNKSEVVPSCHGIHCFQWTISSLSLSHTHTHTHTKARKSKHILRAISL